jgi:hypothetical protein
MRPKADKAVQTMQGAKMNEVTGRDESTREHDAALDDTRDALTSAIVYLRLVCGARRHHIEAGRAIVPLVERYEADCVARDGDTPAIRKQARGSFYQFIANKTNLSCDTIKLYADATRNSAIVGTPSTI